MADVFLSYKHEDVDIARRIADAMRDSGISVWWDDGITPRKAWDTEIEQAISTASSVVVLWSPRSVSSDWVRTEAHYGHDHGKLIPVSVEPCTIPIAFTLTQTVNLSGWNGDPAHLQWRKLLIWIADASNKTGAQTPEDPGTRDKIQRNVIGNLPSGDPIVDGALVSPHTPAGTAFTDGQEMPVMRIVPKGIFLLGTTQDDPDRTSCEAPQRRIDIPAPFAIGVFPVLISEYIKLAGSLPSAPAPPAPKESWFGRFRNPSKPVAQAPAAAIPAGRIPAIHISFDDAHAFVDRLSSAAQQKYRIPSEAEWEYACRAGSDTRYCCGDSIDSKRAAFGLAFGPVETGAFPANAYGLYDMHGNVREWTADLWHDSYDSTPQDGRPALDGQAGMRVVRGGSWRDSAAMLRSAARMRATPSIRADVIGFRVARSIS